MREEMRSTDVLEGLRDVFDDHPGDGGDDSDKGSDREDTLKRSLSSAKAVIMSRRLRWALLFAAGLLIGWLVIGWWIWPVQWTNAMPWHLQTVYQERYVTMVAETFWHSGDVREAQVALEGWEPAELEEILKALQQQAESDEHRQQVAALADALEFPTYDTSIWASLRNQKAVLGGASISVLLFGAAGALAVYSLVQTQTEGGAGALKTISDEGAAMGMGEGGADYDGMGDYDDEVEEGDGLVIGAGEDEEEEGEEEEDLYDAEEDFYEEGEDVVSSLSAFMFDEQEEDTSHLKNLCERLPEIDVSELLEEARQVAGELKRGIELRSRESRF